MDIKDMKRGEWMPGDVKPEAPGVYERDFGPAGSIMFAFWTGSAWCWNADAAEEAYKYRDRRSWRQHIPWRGQLEYDPHNAPDGFVAELSPEGAKWCIGCEVPAQVGACGNWLSQARYPCCGSARPDGRSVIMKRAKP